jgi:protein involved in polysaccharide export with SLBB domain
MGGKRVAERNGIEARNVRLENPDLTLSSVLTNSGGLAYDADLTRIVVAKRNGQQETVNLIELFVKGDRSQDLLLEEGDVIHVSKMDTFPYNDDEFKMLTAAGIYPEQFPVRILGEVEKPGLFYVSADTPYLNTAIALAAGYKRSAVQNAVVINRKTQHDGVAKIVVDPQKSDFMLRPNDVIDIRDGKIAKVIRGGETLSRIAGPFWWVSRWTY